MKAQYLAKLEDLMEKFLNDEGNQFDCSHCSLNEQMALAALQVFDASVRDQEFVEDGRRDI